jgi:hypothetical protein
MRLVRNMASTFPETQREENSLIVIPRVTAMRAQTSLCSRKNLAVSSRNARMPIVNVAQETRNPNMEASELRTPEIFLNTLLERCHSVAGGRCSRSRFGAKPGPKQ